MHKRSAKRRIFDHLARMAKAMGIANRIELLEAVGQGERSVEQLADITGMSVANTSHHLQVLREGGLVRSRRHGVQVFYSLSDDEVATVLAGLGRLAERHLAEVKRIINEELTRGDNLRPVERKELLRLIRSEEVTIIDVRPTDEFEAGHIPGAINIPLAHLPRRLAELPHDREVVAYCRGPYCLLSFDAVRRLRAKGYRARRLADGFPEWKAERHPVSLGAK